VATKKPASPRKRVAKGKPKGLGLLATSREAPVSPEALLEILTANIRHEAAERGLALNSLADFAGVTRSHLFAVLAGDSYPTIEWLAKIAEALEVEPWRLLKPVP
jgi:lambda repressor-like predicted transcriptional regulator